MARFVVIEGVDGSGSTTQVRRLTARLRARGIAAHATCEPSVGPVGTQIRALLERRQLRADGAEARLDWRAMALLFAADRLDHITYEVERALHADQWVICDRYVLSSLIYQTLTAPDPERALPWVQQLNQFARRPELTVVLDVSFQEAARRRAARGGAEELFEGASLQASLAEAYSNSNGPWTQEIGPLIFVDGSRAPQDVEDEIWTLLVKMEPKLED